MDVSVLGTGPAGRLLVERAARSGHDVRVHDTDVTVVMDSVDRIQQRIEDDTADSEAAGVGDRVEATTGLEAAVDGADLVIETATEGTDERQRRVADIETFLDRETLIAVTTKTGSITAAAAGLRHPDRAVGFRVRERSDTRFVELVATEQTAEEAIDRASSFLDSLDCDSVVVGDAVGGASTRLALALEAEAMRLVEEGVGRVEAVDTMLESGYGHLHRPLEHADRVGLDARLETYEFLADTVGERFDPPSVLRERVEAGKTGLDAGEGFYLWESGEPTASALSNPSVVGRTDHETETR
ncbi:3-hydroxyacyl-CoA dehydrogenase family protein [Halovenus marina]|uniref:3-hydroxyacyl-CoA dehydrogenase family protein n=1 Tax=Halovenus marina TaxID=3396621 RepID=UPI003F57BA0D